MEWKSGSCWHNWEGDRQTDRGFFLRQNRHRLVQENMKRWTQESAAAASREDGQDVFSDGMPVQVMRSQVLHAIQMAQLASLGQR